jgi:hypothetical protein
LENKNLTLSETVKLIQALQQKQLDNLNSSLNKISEIKNITKGISKSLTNMKVILNG